jgi:DNA repair protein RadC
MTKHISSEIQVTYGIDTSNEDHVLQVAESILRARLQRLGSITSPTDTSTWLRMKLAGEERELFHVVYLDTRHRIIASETLFHGTIDGAEVHPREVVRACLKHNATACILAHNHPSGNPEPSAADRAVTARLKQSLALVDIRLLDHIVVCAEGTTSLAERGWV